MKKIVSVVMAAVMVCMSAAGCSGQKPAETGSSQTAAGSESASPEGMAGAALGSVEHPEEQTYLWCSYESVSYTHLDVYKRQTK